MCLNPFQPFVKPVILSFFPLIFFFWYKFVKEVENINFGGEMFKFFPSLVCFLF